MSKTMLALGLLVSVFIMSGCENFSMPNAPTLSSGSSANGDGQASNPITDLKEVANELIGPSDSIRPSIISGTELMTLHGWLANMYPWDYLPNQSAVHPVSNLWTPNRRPSFMQISEQCKQIREYGGAAAVLEYSPSNFDQNYWMSNNFAGECGPFFLLYEHIYGTRFISPDGGPKNMDIPSNRQVFKDDIKFMFDNVIVPQQSRYVTVNGKAVIYMWSSNQMTGDFGSLLEEVKNEYPVFFLGSSEIWSTPSNQNDKDRVKALDGFMEYTIGGSWTYLKAVQSSRRTSHSWRAYLQRLELETGKRYIFIPTFQAAYDDTNIQPPRNNLPMYAKSREEVLYHAELIRGGMGSAYDNIGPFVVYSELPEGAAVIESQCLPETIDKPGRYVGCGTARLQILKDYFGW